MRRRIEDGSPALARKWWLQCDRSWGPVAFVEGGEYSCCYRGGLSENAAGLAGWFADVGSGGGVAGSCGVTGGEDGAPHRLGEWIVNR